jgi:hypothetical protein
VRLPRTRPSAHRVYSTSPSNAHGSFASSLMRFPLGAGRFHRSIPNADSNALDTYGFALFQSLNRALLDYFSFQVVGERMLRSLSPLSTFISYHVSLLEAFFCVVSSLLLLLIHLLPLILPLLPLHEPHSPLHGRSSFFGFRTCPNLNGLCLKTTYWR